MLLYRETGLFVTQNSIAAIFNMNKYEFDSSPGVLVSQSFSCNFRTLLNHSCHTYMYSSAEYTCAYGKHIYVTLNS